MHDIEPRLIRCFMIAFPQLKEADVPKASMATVKEWDSVATVTLVSLLEEEFGIQIGLEDVEHLMSFDRFLEYLRTTAVART